MNKKLFYGTGTLLSLIGLGAIVSGIMLILEPDGTRLKMSVDLLENAPFENFIIPGVTLLVINGIFSGIGAFLAFKLHRYAGIAAMLLGGAMIIWIGAQVYWIGWGSWLQPTFLAVGAIEMALGFFLDALHPDNQEMLGSNKGSHAH